MSNLEARKLSLNVLAEGLQIMGDMWVLLIIEILREGPKRFSEIEQLAEINTRTLTQRLKKIEEIHMIQKYKPDPDKQAIYYELTEKGKKALLILDTIEKYIHETL